MIPMENAYDLQSAIQAFEEMMGVSTFAYVVSEIPSMLVSLATYIFTALALYTIAKRRGIHNPWLAWIPFANAWLLGCIADQYRAVARGETKYRRRVLLITEILTCVLAILMLVLMFGMLFNLLAFSMDNWESLDTMSDAVSQELFSAIAGPAVGALLLALVLLPVAIVYAVFSYIALHDIYKSCDPGNATLYLVLSIFIGICQPIFLFICRNRDDGMPPREAPPSAPVQPYVYYGSDYTPRPAEPPVEPWERDAE